MRYTFVVNEGAGRPRRGPALGVIGEEFAEEEIEFLSDSEAAAASAATRPREQVFVAVGGDGTVNRLLPLVSRSGAALGILPTGTANDLARSLGIPHGLRDACRIIRTGSRRSLDLIAVNGVPFATCGGVGLAADAAATANRWRDGAGWNGPVARATGGFIYALAAAREIGRPGRECRVDVEWDGGRLAAPLLAALASNLTRFGGRFRAAPRARMDDGLLDLCLLPAPRNAAHHALVLRAVLGGSVLSIPGSRQAQTQRALIRTERPALFFGDGEILARGCVFALEVRRSALEVLAPPMPAQADPPTHAKLREEAA